MTNKRHGYIEKICGVFIYRIFRIKLSDRVFESFCQFVKFGIVGLSNTILSYVLYVGTLLFLQAQQIFLKTDYLIAQFVGFTLSVLWSFYWNRRFVFEAENDQIPWFKALMKTYCSYAFTGLFLNSVLSVIWIQKLHLSKLIAPIINLLISVPLNFVLNKFWAFKRKRDN